MTRSTDYLFDWIRPLAKTLKILRLVFTGLGVAFIAVGQVWMDSENSWQADWSNLIFWIGVLAVFFSGVFLVLFERDGVSVLLDLRRSEELVAQQQDYITYLSKRESILLTWQTVTKLLSELLDQALTEPEISDEKQKMMMLTTVEILADYKLTLLQIADEYCNISIYEYNVDENLLVCVACYRSRPSDAREEHRKWKVGEGHVGKAFELQRELICGDASAPDVKPWISASPENFDENDDDRYVSLAALPVAVNAEEPIGVLIVTSSEAMRFANSEENHGDEDEQEARRLAAAALQDFAAQIAQIMSVCRSRAVEPSEESADEG